MTAFICSRIKNVAIGDVPNKGCYATDIFALKNSRPNSIYIMEAVINGIQHDIYATRQDLIGGARNGTTYNGRRCKKFLLLSL